MPSISISRFSASFRKSTVLTLAYVGTQGHKLISQYDANPGNSALCMQLNAEGATDLSTGASNPACGPYGEQDTYHTA